MLCNEQAKAECPRLSSVLKTFAKHVSLQIAAIKRSKFSREILGSALFLVDGLNKIGGVGSVRRNSDRHLPYFHPH